MKYCQYCGTQLVDDAKFCSNCGKSVPQLSNQHTQSQGDDNVLNNQRVLINKLSVRQKTNGIIWLVIGCIQIILGLTGFWGALIVGILNIISSVKDIKKSSYILTNQNGIVNEYEPITGAIVVLIYNILIGGVIGILGSIYYLLFVRGFVMENKTQFLLMQTDEPIYNRKSIPRSEKNIYMDVFLTEVEAANGVEKEVFVDGLKDPLKVNFPKNVKNGDKLAI